MCGGQQSQVTAEPQIVPGAKMRKLKAVRWKRADPQRQQGQRRSQGTAIPSPRVVAPKQSDDANDPDRIRPPRGGEQCKRKSAHHFVPVQNRSRESDGRGTDAIPKDSAKRQRKAVQGHNGDARPSTTRWMIVTHGNSPFQTLVASGSSANGKTGSTKKKDQLSFLREGRCFPAGVAFKPSRETGPD
jgi:hypothetical protein